MSTGGEQNKTITKYATAYERDAERTKKARIKEQTKDIQLFIEDPNSNNNNIGTCAWLQVACNLYYRYYYCYCCVCL